MAVRRVVQMGHPVLREVARDVTPEDLASADFLRLVEDMVDTMIEYDGVGLAAPQVAEPIRLVVWVPPGSNEVDVLINPKIQVLDPHDWEETWEGCLSVAGMRGLVRRPDHVSVETTGFDGSVSRHEIKGYAAVVVQHECDHLDGVLYVDRVLDRALVFEREFGRYGAPAEYASSEEEEGELPPNEPEGA